MDEPSKFRQEFFENGPLVRTFFSHMLAVIESLRDELDSQTDVSQEYLDTLQLLLKETCHLFAYSAAFSKFAELRRLMPDQSFDAERFSMFEQESRTATLDAEETLNLNKNESNSPTTLQSLSLQPLALMLYSLIKHFDCHHAARNSKIAELKQTTSRSEEITEATSKLKDKLFQ